MRQKCIQTVHVLSASFRNRAPLLARLVRLTEDDIKSLGKKPEYWPNKNAADRQPYILGIAFQRETKLGSACRGKWLVIEKTSKGGRRSRPALPMEIQEAEYIQDGIEEKKREIEKNACKNERQ